MFTNSHINYVGNEIKYGVNLFITGWNRLLFHPLQTIKDTAYALSHPIQTSKILLNELKLHPIGMGVNFGLSWLTGRAIGAGVKYVSALNKVSHASSGATLSSTISQAIQIGAQSMGGGCCGGICTTTVSRLTQTTSLIASQSSVENLQTLKQAGNQESAVCNGFSPYFDSKKPKCKDGCTDSPLQNTLEFTANTKANI